MTTPDWVYDPYGWDCTYDWSTRDALVEALEIARHSEPRRLATLLNGPDKWVVNIVLTRDECGYPDETEIQWFDSEAEAQTALVKSKSDTP